MDRKNKEDDNTPQYIKDWQIDEWIAELLSDRVFYPKQLPGVKYELSVRGNYLESKGFKHGIKTLKSAGKSMFEAENLKDGKLNIVGTFFIGRNFIKVENIPCLMGEYYLHAGELIRFFRNGVEGEIFKLSTNEICFVIVNIDRQHFLQNCRQRQKVALESR